ncbi:hypothetical protein AJ87_05600 [Rhizobium yanglingense]|nr:hypothetical protein AJ87_05600 [Rhizobium yanglingense]
MPFDTALKIEQRYFTQVLQTTETFSMIRSLFISMQELGKGARRPAGVPRTDLKKSASSAPASWAPRSPTLRPPPVSTSS